MFDIVDKGYQAIDRQSPEYLELAKQRHLQREYKEFYPYMKWALKTLDKLEKKTSHGIFTAEDHVDFAKAKTIINFVEETEKEKESAPTHYIWHTAGDGKVRPSHAANDGETFAWDSPPSTGHPGEGYGCRCTAEDIVPEKEEDTDTEEAEHLQENSSQVITRAAADKGATWDTWDLIHYYFYGNGATLKLHEIGLLDPVIDYAQNKSRSIFKRVEEQIFKKARESGAGGFSDFFIRVYNFGDLVWGIGNATVGGNFKVEVIDEGKFLIIKANIDYYFYDYFYDITNLNQFGANIEPGKSFSIIDHWSTHLDAVIRKNG